jgi:hypothetical protein
MDLGRQTRWLLLAAAAFAQGALAATVNGSATCRTQINGQIEDCLPTVARGELPTSLPFQPFATGWTFRESADVFSFPSSAKATYGLRGSYGYVGALAIAEGNAGPYGGNVSAESRAQASFSDRIQITSEIYSTGTPVWLIYTVLVRGQATSSASQGSYARATLESSVQVNTDDPIFDSFCSGDLPLGSCTQALSGNESVFTYRRQVRIGDSFDMALNISSIAIIGTGSTALYPSGSAEARVEYARTSYARVNPEMQGVELVSESGFDYTSAIPVPEPGTYALILAGLGGVGLAAKRRIARGVATA